MLKCFDQIEITGSKHFAIKAQSRWLGDIYYFTNLIILGEEGLMFSDKFTFLKFIDTETNQKILSISALPQPSNSYFVRDR